MGLKFNPLLYSGFDNPGSFTGTATPVGPAGGDLSGTYPNPSVAFVGTSSASLVHSGELLANAATSANTVSTIVKRDSSGNFSAGTITATLSGNATNITGTVSVVHGGTGLGTLTLNNVILGNGTSTPLFVAPGASGNVLTSDGTTWASTAPASGGANTTLSNLTDTIAINKNFIFDTGSGATIQTKGVGSGATKDLTITTGATGSGGTSGTLNLFSGASGGGTGPINISSPASGGSVGNTGAISLNTGNSGNPTHDTGNVSITTGNANGGTSGSFSVQIGTVTSGTRGQIQLKDGSEGTSGQVWTSTDTLGNGHWAASGGSSNTTTYVQLTDLVKTDSSLSDIPNLSATLTSGSTYIFQAILQSNADDTGGVQYGMGGTVVKNYVIWESVILSYNAGGICSFTRQTNLGDSAGNPNPDVFTCEIRGTIKVTTGGTLTVQFAQQNPSNTSTNLIGSYFVVTKVS